MKSLPTRLPFVLAAAVTIALGLLIYLRGDALPFALRDGLGDALWAAMTFWLVSGVWPKARRQRRALAALLICFAVEFSQLYRAPAIDTLRAQPLGHLILGSDFIPTDLAWYAAGVILAVLIGQLWQAKTR